MKDSVNLHRKSSGACASTKYSLGLYEPIPVANLPTLHLAILQGQGYGLLQTCEARTGPKNILGPEGWNLGLYPPSGDVRAEIYVHVPAKAEKMVQIFKFVQAWSIAGRKDSRIGPWMQSLYKPVNFFLWRPGFLANFTFTDVIGMAWTDDPVPYHDENNGLNVLILKQWIFGLVRRQTDIIQLYACLEFAECWYAMNAIVIFSW